MGGKIIKGRQILSILMMAGAFITAFFFDINVIYIILVCGVIGAANVIYREKKGKGEIKP
jgi:chromate transporter